MFKDISKILILSDMDGTLLNSKKQISNIDKEAIKKFENLGGKFTVATGRTIQSFEQYRSMIELKYPVVMYNGAAIYDYNSESVLYTSPLPLEAKAIAIEIMQNMPDVGGEVLKTDGTYIFSNNDYQKLHTKICNIVPKYMELDAIENGNWLKVLFAMAPEDITHIELFVRNKGYDSVSFVKSSDIFYEMIAQNVSKGSALNEYRKFEEFKDFTFVAIGDFDNDIEMIREADFGVCPANAEKSVKKIADLELNSSCEDGAVAELIEYIIENNN